MPGPARDDSERGERRARSPNSFHALAELTVVGGASLLAIFWIIPGQTAPANAFGLSPSMMPIACATVIALLALLQCIFQLVRRRGRPAVAKGPDMIHSLLIVAAAVIGTLVLARFGLLAGGVVLALLVSLAIGERRLWRNGALCGAVAAVMLLVEWSGI